MNNISEVIKTFLPKYLSSESTKELLDLFKTFPDNLDNRFYTSRLNSESTLFQGDGIDRLPIIDLPNTDIKYTKSILLSNTCDIDPSNERLFPSSICYVPIINLSKYKDLITRNSNKNTTQIESHIQDIRKQRITQILYLPSYGQFEEGIVFLDKVNNISSKSIDRSNFSRLFVLSDYGLYVFLLKISIHFTRIQERIDRFQGIII